MTNELQKKQENLFIQKSNTIVRAVTNESAGILTMKLFNFAILSIKKNEKIFNGKIGFWIKDFCNYYDISGSSLYEKVVHKKQDMNVIKKEIQNITQMQFLLLDEKADKFKFINLFLEGGWNNGYIEFKVNKDLTKKYYLNLKKDYTNIYLPYTKVICSKYSLRLYEYLRSYLYMNARTKGIPNFQHDWNFEELAKILNLSLSSSYFKKITNLKTKILEPVKKDLLKTDIFFTYELIKIGRKYKKIILYTGLDLIKYQSQNIEFEKISSAKKKIISNINLKKEKTFEQSTLSTAEIKKILQQFDEH